MGRPKVYDGSMKVAVQPDGNSRLQAASDRRAVVQLLVDNGGVMSIDDISAHFKFDMMGVVKALVRSGWLVIKED